MYNGAYLELMTGKMGIKPGIATLTSLLHSLLCNDFGCNAGQRWIPKMYRLYRKMTINGHFSI